MAPRIAHLFGAGGVKVTPERGPIGRGAMGEPPLDLDRTDAWSWPTSAADNDHGASDQRAQREQDHGHGAVEQRLECGKLRLRHDIILFWVEPQRVLRPSDLDGA